MGKSNPTIFIHQRYQRNQERKTNSFQYSMDSDGTNGVHETVCQQICGKKQRTVC